jgi:phage terminase large subunit GpA-like protein
MIPLGRAAHSLAGRRIVAVTAAQSGKTDTMLDIIGARLDQRPAPILYVGPTHDFLVDQFEPRLMGLLDEAPSLGAKVGRGKRMKKTVKRVAGVRVRLAHAGSSTALKSDPAALALIDEYDEMSATIRGQGDPLGLVEARGITYSDFVTVIVSTCSRGHVESYLDPESGLEFWAVGEADEVESPIWRLWQEGTRHHWAWPCPHCDEFFVPRFKCLRWNKGATPAQARRDAWLECPRCGCEITNDHKAAMNARGVMVAPGQKIEAGEVVGDPPDSSTVSYWTSGLCSPFVSFGERAEAYLTALMSGEQDKIQTVLNAGFGELYMVGGGGDLPAWEEIRERNVAPYKTGDVPRGVLRVVMGVDVQKRSLIYVIRGFGARGTSWLIEAGFLPGPTEQDEVWQDLERLMLETYGGLPVSKVFIDSGFRPDKPEAGDVHKVYAFARKWSWIVSPTKGHQVAQTPYRVAKIEIKPDGKKVPLSVDLVHLDTDFFKSLVHSRIKTAPTAPGAFLLPEDVTEDYLRQLVSEARVVTRGKKPEWVLRQKANHYLDCEALAAAAGYVLKTHRIPDGVTRDGIDDGAEEPPAAEGEPEEAEAAPDGPEDDPPPPPPPKADLGSIRDRMRRLARR